MRRGHLVTVSKARKGKRGGGQRETEWEGALLTKLFLHFGRWMGPTEEEENRNLEPWSMGDLSFAKF